MTEYKTVEGHPIVRDGEYETRSGEKATVLGFVPRIEVPIVGFIKDDCGFCRMSWDLGGLQADRPLGFDLMRPWKDKPDADGWIKWEGGESPVDDDVMVEVRFRNGEKNRSSTANTWFWPYRGHSGDIIAYRIAKEPEKKTESLLHNGNETDTKTSDKCE